MNQSILFRYVLCAGLLMSLSLNAAAQRPFSSQLICGSTRCDHVIQLIQRHGVNNCFDRSGMSSLLNCSAVGFPQVPVSEFGDLEIVDVHQLPVEGNTAGPKIAVVVSNKSQRAVCNFHVSVVAVLGQIHPFSPHTTMQVDKVNPGEAMEVVLSLPVSVYSMGNRNGEMLSFEKLVVAIDSFDELLETDEANNVKVFNAGEIVVVSGIVGQTAISVIESSTITPTATMQTPVSLAGQSQNRVGTVNGDVSVDALDLAHPTPDSLRSAIQQVGSQEAALQQRASMPSAPQQQAPSQQSAPMQQQAPAQQQAPMQQVPGQQGTPPSQGQQAFIPSQTANMNPQ